jgi:predicted dehydrogenase
VPMNRRDFLSSTAAAAAAVSLSPTLVQDLRAQPRKRRYAIVGTGSRAAGMWGRSLRDKWGEYIDFVGLCDPNAKRAEVVRRRIGVDCPIFTDFDRMVAEARPDLLMVTTVDAYHAEYIIRALDKGIDVITEKPMVTDERQCREVLEAERRNNRKITVGFNMRYSPMHVRIKEILMEGEIGPIRSVDFHWYLDTSHGADYFRRWHAHKEKSGSLWVHKATHHFDFVNWLLAADPVQVHAYGELKRYGSAGAVRSTHCRPCPHKSSCPFYWDITQSPSNMELYANVEDEDGYLRDACVFRESVTSWDTMTANIRYSNDVILAYSLNAYMPLEGYVLAFNGDHGRLDIRSYGNRHDPSAGDNAVYLTKNFGTRRVLEMPQSTGEHGGGDDVLRDMIFKRPAVAPHLELPGSHAGAMSCLTGIAACRSIEEHRTVSIDALLRG